MADNLIDINIEKMMVTANGPVNLAVKTTIRPGELVALFGTSGAGKTTLLRILSGLVNPDKGIVKMGDQVWFDSEKQINVSPQNRNISPMSLLFTVVSLPRQPGRAPQMRSSSRWRRSAFINLLPAERHPIPPRHGRAR